VYKFLQWQMRGIEKTDLDPVKFRSAMRTSALGSIGLLITGSFLALIGAFPLGLVLMGLGSFVFFLPKLLINIRAGSIRELLSTEIVFLTALIQLTFATKAPLDLIIERMTRYRELPGIRTLALAAWNNAKMVGVEPMDALKKAVEKLAPQKLVYRFNSLYTALRIGEDIVAKLSLYMDMDTVEFASNMQRRMDRLTSLISALIVGLAMLSVTAVIVGRGNPVMLILMGGLLPAILGVVLALFVNVPLMKMEFKKLALVFAFAASLIMMVPQLGQLTPLLAAGVTFAGWLITKERLDNRSFERGFMDFVYTIFDELKRSPSVYRAVENAVTYGDYGAFTPKAASILQALRVGEKKLEDVVLKGLQPLMSVVVRMLFDIYRLGSLPRATVDQLQNFVMKLFEYRTQLAKTLNITKFLAVAGAAMVAFVNTAMIMLTRAMTKVVGGGAGTGGIGIEVLYTALGIMSIGYYFLFSKIGFSTRSGLLYSSLLYLAIFVATIMVGFILNI